MRFVVSAAAVAAGAFAAVPVEAATYFFGFDGIVQNSDVPGLVNGSSFTLRATVPDVLDYTARGTRMRSAGWSSVELISGDFKATGGGQFYYSLNPETGVTQMLNFGGLGLAAVTNDTNSFIRIFVNGGRFDGVGSIVAVSSGPSVPEPATWALMIAGFALVGIAARRKAEAAVA